MKLSAIPPFWRKESFMAGKMKQKKGAAVQPLAGKSRESLSVRLGKNIRKNWILYVMILPVLVYYIVFAYAPMYGVQLAFKNYRVKDGIFGSPWVGFDHFKRFFSAYNFKQLLMNTLGISVYSILVGFPIPIIFALMLNYVKNKHLKKAVQMVSYAPYFISTVVMCGMITIFMSTDSGIFNIIRGFLGMEPVDALSKPGWFKSIYVWSGVWQGMGWSSIIASIFFLGGLILVMLGLIGEYIGRIYISINNAPQYTIREIVKLPSPEKKLTTNSFQL